MSIYETRKKMISKFLVGIVIGVMVFYAVVVAPGYHRYILHEHVKTGNKEAT